MLREAARNSIGSNMPAKSPELKHTYQVLIAILSCNKYFYIYILLSIEHNIIYSQYNQQNHLCMWFHTSHSEFILSP